MPPASLTTFTRRHAAAARTAKNGIKDMALSGLDIYKLLPKTNCRECGFATCLAFAMQLAKKTVTIDKCPSVGEEARKVLEASSLPPMRLVTIGSGDSALAVGNETVLFRHEEKFRNPCGIGCIIDDTLSPERLREAISRVEGLRFERVGQTLGMSCIAIRQKGASAAFLSAVRVAVEAANLPLVLMSEEEKALRGALAIAAARRPLLYRATAANAGAMIALSKQYKVPVVVHADGLDALAALAERFRQADVNDLILETGAKPVADTLWELTQARRLALKKSFRPLGYPFLTVSESPDRYAETCEAATFIAKFAGIVLIGGLQPWEAFALLTLRQNIYTDPQKPLQIEPKVYPVGKADASSPLLVTTNFSLSYYTVLGEVEASKVPSYIMSVNTEGMSVLTAWAAEKFNAETIHAAMGSFNAETLVSRKRIIIPGYVAMMSGELQELSGWEVVVGPKEAAGIPSFLKNYT